MSRGATAALALAACFSGVLACSPGDDASPVAAPSVMVPASSTAGRALDVTYRFDIPPGAPPIGEDYTVFVHALDERGTRVWTADHEPPTPTSRWQAGSIVEYTRPMRIPGSAKGGRITLQIGLYSPRTGERLPLSGEHAGRRAYRVAEMAVQERGAGEQTVFFTDGWYDLETPEDAQGLEWRWSKRDATIWLRNPKRDSTLVLELDQPVRLGSEAQQVEVHLGGDLVDAFAVPPLQPVFRRIPLPAAALGDRDVAHVTLRVDRTFVPAHVKGATTNDQRELGVRVFSIAIEPDDGNPADSPAFPGR